MTGNKYSSILGNLLLFLISAFGAFLELRAIIEAWVGTAVVPWLSIPSGNLLIIVSNYILSLFLLIPWAIAMNLWTCATLHLQLSRDYHEKVEADIKKHAKELMVSLLFFSLWIL